MKSRENLLSAWALLVGVIMAIILAVLQITFSPKPEWVYILLAVLGIIIGISTSMGDKENLMTFLLATTCLVIVSSMGQSAVTLTDEIKKIIGTILTALLTMFIPATIIIAVKTVFSAASVK
ncbi:MAG TPA: hypothetical protein P5277_02845 [Candidatus Paceibacterota bacterium]|nr:hypothetical protein [Candidatus Paceibacterota bacterium]